MAITNGDMIKIISWCLPRGIIKDEEWNNGEFPAEVRTGMEIIPHLAERNWFKFYG